MSLKKDALDYHRVGRPGKIEVIATKPMVSQRDLSLAYSPGVAEPCLHIAANPEDVYKYTAKGNLVAVVTNGTAVLGLGDIGPEASKPVMEGKGNLFKKFADIDVFDIELDAKTPEEVIAAVKAIAPTFGGINLEDIKSPDCFYIERRLREELDIPVFHDDQHGTAIIAAAALLNALEVQDKAIGDVKVVFSGAGAAAIATADLLCSLGVKNENTWMCDSRGLIVTARGADKRFPEKGRYAQDQPAMDLAGAMVGADVFLGLSVAGVVNQDMVRSMAAKPIVFAMANPDPEIPYADAKAAVADVIVATGRSDHPNQVNNVLGFPFVFRGALDVRARGVTEEMKMAAVRALAELAHEDVPDSVLRAYGKESITFGPDYLIPKPFDPRVLTSVAPAVAQAAADSGVARLPIQDMQAYKESLERLIARSREFLRPLINRARLSPKRIVFPEGANTKVLRAAQILVDEGICRPVLLGDEWKIIARADAANVSLDGIEVVETRSGGHDFDVMAEKLWALRQRKGFTLARSRSILRQRRWYGCMMVREGLADGLVGGLDVPYSQTLRPALQTIGPDDTSHGVVSGVYAMLFKDRQIFFADCTVNVDPDAHTLAHIALNTARVAKNFGVTPKVALLSYSDFGEHREHQQPRRVDDAVKIIREQWPELVVDGEMMADTAVNAELAGAYPFSAVQGDANVLVFPSLSAGNIAYKLLRELGGATALGPLLVGLSKPVNVVPTGATVDDIVSIAALTVNQAIDA